MEQVNQASGKRLGWKDNMTLEGRFQFDCHPGLECFGHCCRNINIYLTPYDVIRMKKNLGLSSEEFHREHTLRYPGARQLAVVQIKMRDDEKQTCPFLTPNGCRIYADRPWSCRMAPVDMLEDGVFRINFDPARCLGLLEPKSWTVAEWLQNQGINEYEAIEAGFKDLPKQLQFPGFSALDDHLARLFYTVCYNVDRFRRLIFESRFLEVFPTPPETVEKIKSDDIALLRFGIDWLAAKPDLRQTIALRDEAFPEEGLPL